MTLISQELYFKKKKWKDASFRKGNFQKVAADPGQLSSLVYELSHLFIPTLPKSGNTLRKMMAQQNHLNSLFFNLESSEKFKFVQLIPYFKNFKFSFFLY